MKRKLNTLLIALTLLLFCNCENKILEHENYMVFDSVDYINKFPNNYTLKNKDSVNVDLIGVWDFTIFDSLLILSNKNSSGFWKIYQLPKFDKHYSFLNIGEGPFEFNSHLSASDNVNIMYEKNNIVAYLYDFERGNNIKFNISNSIENDSLHISILNDSIPKYLFDFYSLNETDYYMKELKNKETQQIRTVSYSGIKKSTKPMKILNKATVNSNLNINIITTMTKFSKENKKLVEMNFGLNYINIYSLDGAFQKTICIGDELDSIEKIENTKYEDRYFQFSDLRIYDDFFGVIYIHEKEKDYISNSIFRLGSKPYYRNRFK